MLLTWDFVEFILLSFFFRYWVSITRLISDKTRINYCSFPRGQVFPLGIRLTRLTMSRSAGSFKREVRSFLFSQGSLRGIILEFGFLHIPNYVLGFSTNKGNSLCVFIPRGINGN